MVKYLVNGPELSGFQKGVRKLSTFVMLPPCGFILSMLVKNNVLKTTSRRFLFKGGFISLY